ncbi:hypothetical protein QZH41_007568 [Actinostola sp. cb2023]|nr:hypothetical protein QZH41_007568 [Actinostola sp. cb2023]
MTSGLWVREPYRDREGTVDTDLWKTLEIRITALNVYDMPSAFDEIEDGHLDAEKQLVLVQEALLIIESTANVFLICKTIVDILALSTYLDESEAHMEFYKDFYETPPQSKLIEVVPEISTMVRLHSKLDLVRTCLKGHAGTEHLGPGNPTTKVVALFCHGYHKRCTFAMEIEPAMCSAVLHHQLMLQELVEEVRGSNKGTVFFFKNPQHGILSMASRGEHLDLCFKTLSLNPTGSDVIPNQVTEIVDDVINICSVYFGASLNPNVSWNEIDAHNAEFLDPETEEENSLESILKANVKLEEENSYLKNKVQEFIEFTEELQDKLTDLETKRSSFHDVVDGDKGTGGTLKQHSTSHSPSHDEAATSSPESRLHCFIQDHATFSTSYSEEDGMTAHATRGDDDDDVPDAPLYDQESVQTNSLSLEYKVRDLVNNLADKTSDEQTLMEIGGAEFRRELAERKLEKFVTIPRDVMNFKKRSAMTPPIVQYLGYATVGASGIQGATNSPFLKDGGDAVLNTNSGSKHKSGSDDFTIREHFSNGILEGRQGLDKNYVLSPSGDDITIGQPFNDIYEDIQALLKNVQLDPSAEKPKEIKHNENEEKSTQSNCSVDLVDGLRQKHTFVEDDGDSKIPELRLAHSSLDSVSSLGSSCDDPNTDVKISEAPDRSIDNAHTRWSSDDDREKHVLFCESISEATTGFHDNDGQTMCRTKTCDDPDETDAAISSFKSGAVSNTQANRPVITITESDAGFDNRKQDDSRTVVYDTVESDEKRGAEGDRNVSPDVPMRLSGDSSRDSSSLLVESQRMNFVEACIQTDSSPGDSQGKPSVIEVQPVVPSLTLPSSSGNDKTDGPRERFFEASLRGSSSEASQDKTKMTERCPALPSCKFKVGYISKRIHKPEEFFSLPPPLANPLNFREKNPAKRFNNNQVGQILENGAGLTTEQEINDEYVYHGTMYTISETEHFENGGYPNPVRDFMVDERPQRLNGGFYEENSRDRVALGVNPSFLARHSHDSTLRHGKSTEKPMFQSLPLLVRHQHQFQMKFSLHDEHHDGSLHQTNHMPPCHQERYAEATNAVFTTSSFPNYSKAMGEQFHNTTKEGIKSENKQLHIDRQNEDKQMEMSAAINMGTGNQRLNQYDDAIFHFKWLHIPINIGDKEMEMTACLALEEECNTLDQYGKAIACHKKSLEIAKEMGDKQMEMRGNHECGYSLPDIESIR